MIKSEKWDIIIEVISGGLTDKDACHFAGVSRESFYRKIRENSDFSDKVKKAQIEFKKYHIDIITEASKKNWQASAWLLERKFKPEFSRTETYIAEKEENRFELMTDEELEEQMQEIFRRSEEQKYLVSSNAELENILTKEIDRLRKTYRR